MPDDPPIPIVLAAGPGSRLGPLSNTRPKPMVPVAGKPILEWCLKALGDAGLEEVVIVVGHKASTIQRHVREGSELGLDVTYVTQEQQVGTAHAVATALEETGVPETGLVLGGDNVVSARLIEALVDEGPDAIAVTKSDEASRYGVVDVEKGRIQALEEKPLAAEGESLISTGCYLFQRRTLDRIARLVEEGVPSMAEVLAALLEGDHEIRASVTSGDWHDAVYPWDLVSMTAHLLRRHGAQVSEAARLSEDARCSGAVHVAGGVHAEANTVLEGPSALHANVRVRPGAQVSASLLFDGVRLGRGAIAEHSVLAEGVTVGAGAVLGAGPATPRIDGQAHDVERMGAVVGEGSTIGPGAVLAPGTIVGAEATVAPGARVSGTVPDGGWVQ